MYWLQNEIFISENHLSAKYLWFMSCLLNFYDVVTAGYKQRLELRLVAKESLSKLFESLITGFPTQTVVIISWMENEYITCINILRPLGSLKMSKISNNY